MLKKDSVSLPEMALGYFLGPFGVLIVNAVFTCFLNRFYTDALGLSGKFITALPLVCTIFVTIANIILGILIDRTRTKMGKARPYLLVAAPLMVVSCVLMFSVPTGNIRLELIWIAVSYNLYFAVAYPIYFLSHSMMVPLSTRDSAARGKLSVISNAANMGAAGLFASILFPMLIYPRLKNQRAWLICMSIMGAVALAGALVEFCFTRERITEELYLKKLEATAGEKTSKEELPLKQQLKGVVTDKYWWLIIVFYLLFNLSGGMKNLSMSYYCDYIVGKYQDGITQTLLAVFSGIPMVLGMFTAWPLAKKFGKKNCTVAGLWLAVAGGVISFTNPTNFIMVAIGVTIKTLGTIPACYVMMALFADVLDHLERKNGYRSDGLSMSLYSIITVPAGGIMTAVFNGLISLSGYQPPQLVNGVMEAAVQNDATKWVIIMGFLGAEMIAYAILAVTTSFLKVEEEQKEVQK